MGYSGDYSLYARCFSEFASTLTYCLFLGCLHANKLLPKTKASDLCFGWLAFGVGLVIYSIVQLFGHISAIFNPAATLGAAIVGNIDWIDYPFLVLSQLIGGFVGNFLMWIYYLPQFETDPEPAPTEDNDRLLHTRDDITPAALNFVSYSTRPETAVPAAGAGLCEFGRMLSATRSEPSQDIEQLRVFSISSQGVRRNGLSLRNSVSVSYADNRLNVVDSGTSSRRRRASMALSDARENEQPLHERVIDVDSRSQSRRKSIDKSVELKPLSNLTNAQEEANSVANDSAKAMDESSLKGCFALNDNSKAVELEVSKRREQKELDPKMVASQIADQQMKLSIFCTRPARYLPISNLVTEILATFYLVAGILCIRERAEFLYDGFDDLYMHGMFAFLVGMFCAVLVLCFGGMGISMNPARDFVGRFAHWVLPIDGKGASEWYYAFITVIGPLIGGALGGFAFLAMKALNKGQKEGVLA